LATISKADFSSGLAHKACCSWADAEGTPEELNKFAESPLLVGQVLQVMRGQAKIVPVEKPQKERPKPPKPLLGPPVDIITVPDREEFVVPENFAKLWGSNCEKWFRGKVEEPITGAILRAQRLLRPSTDPAIIAALGGSLKARITLADINAAKESGALKKGVVYIGYKEDEIRFPADEPFSYINEKGDKCVLRAVDFVWSGDGWSAFANSVGLPDEWSAGNQVLSRNSC